MQLNELKRDTKNKSKIRVGRGGKRGKTSGRGHKGQKAHGGHGIRPEMRDVIKKLPKLRGHGKNRARTVNDGVVKSIAVNLAILESTFKTGDIVSPKVLADRKIVRNNKGKPKPVKILGNGEITKKLSISGCAVSKSAMEKIEKAGGKIEA
jgi:large subunit ribosomal protein L15